MARAAAHSSKTQESTAACHLRVRNRVGLHLRAAAEIVKLVRGFEAEIIFEYHGVKADAGSILSIASLAATSGARISARATGAEAAKALDALATFFATGFGEEIPDSPSRSADHKHP